MANENTQYIFNYLASRLGNEIGASALMGNLQAESGIISYRLQGDFSSGYTKSLDYTSKVDSGIISREQFISDSKGYSLAQWTSSGRKAGYYDYVKARGGSIGDTDNAVGYLVYELQTGYPSVWSALQSATDLQTASTIVLKQFEAPKDQSAKVQVYRASLGNAILRQYGTGVIPPMPDPPAPTPTPETNYSHIICLLMDDDERKEN